MKSIVIGGCGAERFGQLLARRLRVPYGKPAVNYFPDGELKLKLPVQTSLKGRDALLVYTFQPYPDEVLIEALFAMGAARQQGARRITLVVPYLGFMRQDKMFHPGEAVSNRIVADLLGRADRVVTMDPHLHRIRSLKQIFKARTTTLTADAMIADHLKRKHRNAIVMGPDEESSQWAADVAKRAGVQSIILKKKRYSPTKVRIVLKSRIPLKGRDVVIVDDIISTGRTMIEPIRQLKKAGVRSVTCIGVHGVFSGNALQDLRRLGAKVETTNTIANPVATIDVTPAFAEVLR